MMSNAMRAFSAVSDVKEAVAKVVADPDSEEKQFEAEIKTHLTDPMESFFMATSKLHAKMVHIDHSVALGESTTFIRRRKRPDASVASGGVCRKNEECKSGMCEGNKHGLKDGNCKAITKRAIGAACEKNVDCKTGICRGNKGGLGSGQCASTSKGDDVKKKAKAKVDDVKKKAKEIVDPAKLVPKLKAFFAKTGLSKVFGYIWGLAKQFMTAIMMLLKRAIKWVGKNVFKLLPNTFWDFFKKLAKCGESGGELRKQKCSYGVLRRANATHPAACLNGGGAGMNWLWAERIDTRKAPKTWMSERPDASECHDQTNPSKGGKYPKPCFETGDFCANRYKDFAGKWETKEQKEYWHRWDYKNMKAKCEGTDGRCKFLDMYREGLVSQAGFRCVPKIHKNDPRYEPQITFKANGQEGFHDSYSKAIDKRYKEHAAEQAKKGKAAPFRKDDLDLAQFSAAKWQMPVKAYVGGPTGLQVAAGMGSKQWAAQRQLNKGYIQTGDFCINYKLDKNGNFPATRSRCASQQYFWSTDLANPFLCADLRPSLIGTFLVEWLILPIFKILPGGMEKFVGPAMTAAVATFAGAALDNFLAHMLPFFFSYIYVGVARSINAWTQFDLRNILTQDVPEEIVTRNMGIHDWALDSTMDRMQSVYYNKTCPVVADKKTKEEKLFAADTGCPDSIPVRHLQATGNRAGDIADGPFTSLWPGRIWIRVGTQRMRVAYIKQSMCMKLPVCDTKLFASRGSNLYGGGKTGLENTDCSGHGQCRWNKKLGNHCHCDPGYWYLKEHQKCCKGADGDNKATCIGQDQKGNEEATKNAPDQKGNEDATKNAFIKGFAEGHKNAGGKTQLGEVKTPAKVEELGTEKLKEPTRVTKWKESVQRWGARLTDNGSTKVSGIDESSIGCSSLVDSAACEGRVGCMVGKKGNCEDATTWNCAVQKKILDCLTTPFLSPWKVPAGTDQWCGKTIFGQRQFSRTNRCTDGVRHGMLCDPKNGNKDCPANPIHGVKGDVETELDSTGGMFKHQSNKCKSFGGVRGCQDEMQMSCSDLGYENYAAMAL